MKRHIALLVMAVFAIGACGDIYAQETKPTDSAPVLTDPQEAPAETAVLAADWPRAYEIYNRLILANLKNPLGEYYFYRLLWVIGYSAGTAGEALPKTLKTIIKSSKTNEALRALALWVQMNNYLKQGELKKAQADCTRLGFIKPWLFIGPFENEEETGFKKEFAVEKELDLDKTYKGKHGQNQWFHSLAQPVWGWIDMGHLFRLREDVLSYALTFIKSPQDQTASFRLGSDGAVKLWLNDQLILESDTYRSLYLDQNIVGVRLTKGWNKLLVKVCQKRGPWRFMIRVTDPTGKPLTSLQFENDPAKIKKLKTVSAKESVPENIKVERGVLDYLKVRLETNPDDAVSLIRAAFIYDTKHSLDENDRTDRDYLNKAAALNAQSAVTWLALAWTEPERNKRLKAYRQALKIAPQSPLAFYEISHAYTGDTEWYKDLTFDWEDIFEAWLEGEEFDYEQAIRRAQKDTLSPKRRSFPVEEKEKSYLEEALRLKPDFLVAKISLGKLYYRRGNLWKNEAIRLFKEILAVNPNNLDLQELVLQERSESMTIDEEISLYESLLKSNFSSPKIRKQLLGRYQNKCLLDKAVNLYQDALKVNPYNYAGYQIIASLYRSQDQLDKAIGALEKALTVCPEAVAILDKLGTYYHLAGDEAKAITLWEKALKIKPQLKKIAKHLKALKPKEEDFWKGYEEDLTAYIEQAKQSQRSEDKESALWLLNNQIIKVKPNGTSSTFIQQVIKVFDEKARSDYGSVYAFPRGHDYYLTAKSEVKCARLIRKDGTEIEGQYYEDSSYASFPRLELEDIIIFECQTDEVGEARYKGYFGLMCPLQSRDDPVKTSKLTVLVPKTKPLYFQAIRIPDEPEIKEKDDLIIRTWKVNDIPEIKYEYFKPSDFEIWPYLHISTFKTWDEVAEWFWGIAKDQLESSTELKQAVKKATEGLTTKKEKIRALFQLMVSQIRYEFLSLEAHYFKPFKACDTFARKYGDCKDTAILLVTMLKEAGIPANLVLIRAMPSRTGVVDTALPSMKVFNHCIAHVPEVDGEDLFLDGTARYFGTEELPYMDQGAVTFVVSPKEKGKCIIMPYDPPEKNIMEHQVQMTLNSDTSAQLQATIEVKGLMAPRLRYQFQEGTKRELLFEQYCNQYFKGTKIESLDFSDISNYDLPVEIKTKFKVTDFSRTEGAQLIFKPCLFPPELYGMPLKYFALAQTRHYDVVLPYPQRMKTQITYQIPQGYKIKTLPEAVSIENEYARFNMGLKQIGEDKIQAEYLMEIKVTRIPKVDYTKFRDFCVQVEKAVDEEVVLEKE